MAARSTPAATARAASAALAQASVPELECDRILLVDDSDEDATQILTVVTERTGLALRQSLEAPS